MGQHNSKQFQTVAGVPQSFNAMLSRAALSDHGLLPLHFSGGPTISEIIISFLTVIFIIQTSTKFVVLQTVLIDFLSSSANI